MNLDSIIPHNQANRNESSSQTPTRFLPRRNKRARHFGESSPLPVISLCKRIKEALTQSSLNQLCSPRLSSAVTSSGKPALIRLCQVGNSHKALSSDVLITRLDSRDWSPGSPTLHSPAALPGQVPGPESAVTHHCRWNVWPQWMAATSREWSKKSEQMVHSARIGMMTGFQGPRWPRKPRLIQLCGCPPLPASERFKFGSTERLPG